MRRWGSYQAPEIWYAHTFWKWGVKEQQRWMVKDNLTCLSLTLISSPTETLMEQNRSAGGDWFRERPNICAWTLGEEEKLNANTANVRWRPSEDVKPLLATWTEGEKKLTRRRGWTRRWPAASCSPSWGSWSTSSNSGRSTDVKGRKWGPNQKPKKGGVKGGF